MKNILLLGIALSCVFIVSAQDSTHTLPCSHEAILSRFLRENPNGQTELIANEYFTIDFVQQLVEKRKNSREDERAETYIIPLFPYVHKISCDKYSKNVLVLKCQ